MNEPLSIVIDDTNNIVLKITGDLSQDRLEALHRTIELRQGAIKDIYDESKFKINILLDMSEFNGEYSVEALEEMVAFAKNNEPYVAKTAGFGGPDRGAFATEIVAALAKRENIHFFSNKEEALTWLQN